MAVKKRSCRDEQAETSSFSASLQLQEPRFPFRDSVVLLETQIYWPSVDLNLQAVNGAVFLSRAASLQHEDSPCVKSQKYLDLSV